jgi:N-acetyl-anhydromuramyl-L-alanine amidase AmpD
MKIQIAILFLLMLPIIGLGQQNKAFVSNDFSETINFVSSKTDTSIYSEHDHSLWHFYLGKEHPSIITIENYMIRAADEFQVPVEILKVIAQVETNWTQIGPGIDKGWGMMHLVENNYANTLLEASELLNLNPQVLKDDPLHNIRGMAALLRNYQYTLKEEPKQIEDWFTAVKQTTGLATENLREAQAYRYFETLNNGIKSKSLWGELIIIEAQDMDIKKKLNPENPYLLPAEKTKSPDYPPAILNLTECNFAEGRNHEIDAWVNHWIGVGTYAGAISWFHNCDAEVSAHFVIRSSDGEITQVVEVNNTAWHCGASGYPYNNSRSIGVEHEATITNPELWNSMPMLQASASMASYFCNEYEIPKERNLPGINGHQDMPGTNTMCPGNLPWLTWMSLLDENYSEPDLVIMDMWTDPENPEMGSFASLFVEVKNVGSATADSTTLDYRIDNLIIGYDTVASLAAGESQILSFEQHVFIEEGSYDYCVYIDEVAHETNILNNSYCIDIQIDPVFAIDELNSSQNIKLYPNPTNGVISITRSSAEIRLIEVFNLQASLIETIIPGNTTTIDISHLYAGTYILKLTDIKGNYTSHKIIKK